MKFLKFSQFPDLFQLSICKLSNEKDKKSYFSFVTHPELFRFTSEPLCPSLCKRGAKTPHDLKYFSLKTILPVLHLPWFE